MTVSQPVSKLGKMEQRLQDTVSVADFPIEVAHATGPETSSDLPFGGDVIRLLDGRTRWSQFWFGLGKLRAGARGEKMVGTAGREEYKSESKERDQDGEEQTDDLTDPLAATPLLDRITLDLARSQSGDHLVFFSEIRRRDELQWTREECFQSTDTACGGDSRVGNVCTRCAERRGRGGWSC